MAKDADGTEWDDRLPRVADWLEIAKATYPALAEHGFTHAQGCLTQAAAIRLHTMVHDNDPTAATTCARTHIR
jgi:hypothetical protein